MNERLARLQPYPFERLNALKHGVIGNPAYDHVPLSIGEPKHPPPAVVVEAFADQGALAADLAQYPATRGEERLRVAVAAWVEHRFGAPVDPATQILPVAGTREALFSFGQAVVGAKANPVVVMPNPFYQIYEGATLLAGAEPWFVNALADNNYLGDLAALPDEVWARVELVYLCSPGNPTGRVIPAATLGWLIEQAHRHDFVIAADECYSEIHDGEPPTGLLTACRDIGNDHYERCVVFHSLSKRSSLPGLRSGFIAGDARILADYYLYRTYQGCALPPHTQRVSALAWGDEQHVTANQLAYRAKFDAVLPVLAPHLGVYRPEGAFYLWARVPGDDETFARELFRERNVTVLPGGYLGRSWQGVNPGHGHVRIALVAPVDVCVEAAGRIADWLTER
jgi:N-succinyldiaminopimelate aminotransferase